MILREYQSRSTVIHGVGGHLRSQKSRVMCQGPLGGEKVQHSDWECEICALDCLTLNTSSPLPRCMVEGVYALISLSAEWG